MKKIEYNYVPVPKGIYRQLKGDELRLFTYLIENVSFYESIGKTFKRSVRDIVKELGFGKNGRTLKNSKISLKEKGLIDYVDGVYGGDTESTSWFINWSAFSHQNGDSTVTKTVTEQSPKWLLNSHQNGDIYKNNIKNNKKNTGETGVDEIYREFGI